MKTNRLTVSIARLAAIAWLSASLAANAFDLKDTEGKRHRLADYKGRWVVVNFWATWCAPCVAEIPEIAKFARERAADVVVVGIALDVDGEEKTRQFARKVGHTYPLVLGDDATEKQFGKKVKGLPTTVIFDPVGKRTYDKLGVVTHKLLNESTKK